MRTISAGFDGRKEPNRKVRRDDRQAFSLVEVVLAIGIFSFAMVAILALFGSSIGGVKKLADRDILVAAGSSVAEKLDALTRSNLSSSVPAGTNPSDRPTFYCFAPDELLASMADTDIPQLSWTTNAPPAPADVNGGRVFRARIFRANETASGEYAFSATNISFPVRVVVDLLAPGQDNETPAMSWSFHRVLLPKK